MIRVLVLALVLAASSLALASCGAWPTSERLDGTSAANTGDLPRDGSLRDWRAPDAAEMRITSGSYF